MLENTEQKILQKHLAQFLISDVFNTITEDDLLKIKAPNVWEHKGQRLTEGQVNILRGEAGSFKESMIWKTLKAELLWLAKTGYSKSKGEADLVAVKVLELVVKTVDDKISKMIEI